VRIRFRLCGKETHGHDTFCDAFRKILESKQRRAGEDLGKRKILESKLRRARAGEGLGERKTDALGKGQALGACGRGQGEWGGFYQQPGHGIQQLRPVVRLTICLVGWPVWWTVLRMMLRLDYHWTVRTQAPDAPKKKQQHHSVRRGSGPKQQPPLPQPKAVLPDTVHIHPIPHTAATARIRHQRDTHWQGLGPRWRGRCSALRQAQRQMLPPRHRLQGKQGQGGRAFKRRYLASASG